jgi:hypothetical protein
MRAFACDHCANLVWFDNDCCLRCGYSLGFDRASHTLLALLEDSDTPGLLTSYRDGRGFRRCANSAVIGCSWLVPEGGNTLCEACALTRTRPPGEDAGGMAGWADAEAAKRRLLYQLDDLGLPVQPRDAEHPNGLAFDLLSSRDKPVTTGHADGLITIDLAEGDDAHREAVRTRMAEPYRTMLGHFRHEVGHYYESVLVLNGPRVEECRELFGDDRANYLAALGNHYDNGPPEGWEDHFVSAYATTHPYEDWAETFAHYLHIRDTLQTASSVGLYVAGPDAPVQPDPTTPLSALPMDAPDLSAQQIIDTWLPLTYALNAVERSMGKDDLYPFVLAPDVLQKLAFVHDIVTHAAQPSLAS